MVTGLGGAKLVVQGRPREWPGWFVPITLACSAVVYVGVMAMAVDRFTFWLPEDWILFGQRSNPSPESLFAPLNGHWVTGPVLVTEGMLRSIGLWYPGYLGVVTAAHFAVVALVYLVLKRMVDAWLAALAAILVLFLASASEALFGFISIGFLLSVAFGLGALLVGLMPASNGRVLASWCLLLCSLASSGVGVVMVVVGAFAASSCRRGLVAASTLVVYAAWATIWPSRYGQAADGSIVDFGVNATRVVAAGFVGGGMRAPLLVLVIVLSVGIVLVRGWRPQRLSIAAAIGLVTLYLAIGYRAGWDPAYAEPSRYLYPAVILVLLAVTPALAQIPAVAAIVLTVAIAVNISGFPHAIDNWASQSRAFRAEAAAVERGDVRPSGILEPHGPTAALYLAVVARWGRP